MALLMLSSVLLSTVVGTYVGLRLLALARRTRQSPELAVGLSLVSYATVSQVLLLVFEALGPDADAELREALTVVRILAYLVMLLGLVFFTWRVFGGERRWRSALAAAIVAVALPGAVVAMRGYFQQIELGTLAPLSSRVILNVCFIVTYAWMGAEALHYHGLMRRRQALGLADPIVTNRFLLWGGGAAASAVLVAAMLVLAATGNGLGARNPAAYLLVTFIGLLNTTVWALTFTPPESYLRRVRSQGGRMETVHG